MRVWHFVITGIAALLGGVAALLAVCNSRLPPAGIVSCPVLLFTVPVFDYLAPELDDMWLSAGTAAANAATYALAAWAVIVFVGRRLRRRHPSAS